MKNTLTPTLFTLSLALALAAMPAQAERGDRGDRGQRGDRASSGHHARGDHRGPDRSARRDRHEAGRGHVVVRPHVRPIHRPIIRPIVGVPRYSGHGYYGHKYYGHGYRHISPRYPRHGLVIRNRPALWTWVTVGTLAYLYADGVYYREHRGGGYEVVAPPADTVALETPVALPAHYVYPRQGQTAERQASDEYECHQWAVQQTGFDPSSVAAGTSGDPQVEQLSGYPRARDACLDGRGYTVR